MANSEATKKAFAATSRKVAPSAIHESIMSLVVRSSSRGAAAAKGAAPAEPLAIRRRPHHAFGQVLGRVDDVLAVRRAAAVIDELVERTEPEEDGRRDEQPPIGAPTAARARPASNSAPTLVARIAPCRMLSLAGTATQRSQ